MCPLLDANLRPPGATAMQLAPPSGEMTRKVSPVSKFQIRIVPSIDAEATRDESSNTARSVTARVWPDSVRISAFPSECHNGTQGRSHGRDIAAAASWRNF